MECKKCKAPGTVLLRKRDLYCNDCFITNANHKFRACLGKNKVFASYVKVLMCLSGGVGSTVLIDLVHNGISLDNHKKLRVIPMFLHLRENENDEKSFDIANSIISQCKKYNFYVYVAHISDYMLTENKVISENCIQQTDVNTAVKFQAMLNSMPPTTRKDFLTKVKRNLFIRYAHQLECNIILTAETTTTLAINLLSNLAIGRGSQIENEIGFCDTRNENVKILRPMKDISAEELNHYVKVKQLAPACDDATIPSNSLQSVIKMFVIDLQENFQATTSTVCKTADKLGVNNRNVTDKKCLLCENNLTTKEMQLSALEATKISRVTSFGKTVLNCAPEKDIKHLEICVNKQSMFPFIYKHLCYSCSRNYAEMNDCTLPEHIQKTLKE